MEENTGLDLSFKRDENKTYNLCTENTSDFYLMTISAWQMDSSTANSESLSSKIASVEDAYKSMTEATLKSVAKSVVEGVVGAAADVAEVVSNPTDAYETAVKSVKEGWNELMSSFNSYTDGASKTKTILNTFILPVPQTLTDSLRHNYEEDTFSPLDFMTSKIPWLTSKALNPKNRKTGINQEDSIRVSTAAVKFNADMLKRNNASSNQNLINIYKSTECREFIFNVTLIPESSTHANGILKGILALKYYMTGETIGANLLIRQQCCFTVKFNNSKFENYMMLNDEIELNLETLEVDVSGAPYSSYNDGIPKTIQLILTLKERRPARNVTQLEKPKESK